MSSQTVLVAGGAGYIGSHTAKALHMAGLTPLVLDNLSTGHRSNIRFGPFYETGIADAAAVRRIAEEHHPVGAILFAGYIAVGESTGNPRKYFYNNVTELLALLDALLDCGIRRIVFSSSAAVYGIQDKMPLTEDSPKSPVSPYAETKWFFERVLEWYGSAYGVKHVSLRYFNAAGADPDGELGECHQPETHLIPLAIRAALGGAPLRVFGTDYPTPDGTAIRDYIHVTDLADAHVRALEYLQRGGASLAMNLGTGQGHSVREVLQTVEGVGHTKVPVDYAPRREGDAPVLIANPARARQILEWTPQYSSLDTIVRTAWDWHRKESAGS
jgi:UDP-arabinose 4-epimerase